MAKAQFQSSEQIQVRFPPFMDSTTGQYIIGGDTATMSIRKGDGTTQTGVSLTWDSVVHMWYVNLTPTLPDEAGEWRFKAASSNANAFPQWKILHVGDYIDKLDAAVSTRTTQDQILSDATPFPGARIDAAVTTRATPTNVTDARDSIKGASSKDISQVYDEVDTRLTTNRASYLDKLNVTGNVASSAEVLAIQNNTSTRISLPNQFERPESSTTTYIIDLYLYDAAGHMEDPDETPTLAVKNEAGVDRSANLTNSGVLQHIALGHYQIGYVVGTPHALEQLRFDYTIIEEGLTRIAGASTVVGDLIDVHFSQVDRDNITAIKSSTDNLPADPSSEATVQDAVAQAELAAGSAADAVIAAEAATSAAESAATAAGDAASAVSAMTPDVILTRKMIANGWKVQGTQLIVFDDDGVSIHRLFDLKDETGTPSGSRVFQRVPA